MIKKQKTLLAAAFLGLACFGVYEARQTASLRKHVQTLQHLQAPLAEQIEQLQNEGNTASNQLTLLREANALLNRNTAELLRLRGQLTRQNADLRTSLASELAYNEQGDLVGNWLSRAIEMKKLVEKLPKAAMPEFRYLRDEDWLDVARHRHLDDRGFPKEALDNDVFMEGVLEQLMIYAKENFGLLMSAALRGYVEANAGELPAQLAQLKPFFTVPVGDDVLERYEMMHSGNVKDFQKHERDWSLVSEKKSAAKASGDIMIQIGTNSFQTLNVY